MTRKTKMRFSNSIVILTVIISVGMLFGKSSEQSHIISTMSSIDIVTLLGPMIIVVLIAGMIHTVISTLVVFRPVFPEVTKIEYKNKNKPFSVENSILSRLNNRILCVYRC